MLEKNRLENEGEPKAQRNEQVARSFTECQNTCPWYGRCLNGTKFDDGKGKLKPGKLVPFLKVSNYSPCFLIPPSQPIRGVKSSKEDFLWRYGPWIYR